MVSGEKVHHSGRHDQLRGEADLEFLVGQGHGLSPETLSGLFGYSLELGLHG